MFTVATDGACKGNPGPATWAFVVFLGENIQGHRKGSDPATTNNAMELTAIVKALAWAKKHNKKIHIITDSQYCYNGITKWMQGWQRNHWRTKENKPIKNIDLWKKIQLGSNTIEWVRGHSGHPKNEMADMYCNEEYIKKFL